MKRCMDAIKRVGWARALDERIGVGKRAPQYIARDGWATRLH